MSVLHRRPVAAAVALALLAAAPAYAQEPPAQPPFGGHRPPPGQRPFGGQRPVQGQHFQGQPHPGPVPPAAPEAQRRHGSNAAGIAAGVLGGIAAGALLGGALSGGPAAAPPPPVEGGYGVGCPLVRRPVYDGNGEFAGYQAVPSC